MNNDLTIGKQIRINLHFAEEILNKKISGIFPPEITRYTVNQLHTLTTVYELTKTQPDGIRLKELAEKLQVTPAAASEMVNTLVRKKALCREQSKNDRRAILIKLVNSLFQKYQQCEQTIDDAITAFINQLPIEQQNFVLQTSAEFANFLKKNYIKA